MFSLALTRPVSRSFQVASNSGEGAVPINPGWVTPANRTPGICRDEAYIPSKSLNACKINVRCHSTWDVMENRYQIALAALVLNSSANNPPPFSNSKTPVYPHNIFSAGWTSRISTTKASPYFHKPKQKQIVSISLIVPSGELAWTPEPADVVDGRDNRDLPAWHLQQRQVLTRNGLSINQHF